MTPYADETYAVAYFAERLNTGPWDNAQSADRVKALKWATRLIDSLPLILEKATVTQERSFPRIGYTEIPPEVKDACCEIALALLAGRTPDALDKDRGVTTENLGDQSTNFGEGKERTQVAEWGLPSSEAARLLAPWLHSANEVRLDRV